MVAPVESDEMIMGMKRRGTFCPCWSTISRVPRVANLSAPQLTSSISVGESEAVCRMVIVTRGRRTMEQVSKQCTSWST